MFPEKGNIRYTKGSLEVNSTWLEKQRAAKRDMADISGEINRRSMIDLAYWAADVCRQAEMEILGKGRMSSLLFLLLLLFY